MHKNTESKQQSVRPLSKQELKNLRRAEARHRIELLQEAKTLHDHLADFWDESLDQIRDKYATDMRLYSTELETITGIREYSADTKMAKRTKTALENVDLAFVSRNVSRRQ